MGGKAFASAVANGHSTISTPRMTEQEYNNLRNLVHRRLEGCLPSAHVSTMIEAPSKDTYGDIDFIVATDDDVDLVNLARQLGAAAILPAAQTITMAMRKDDQLPDHKAVVYHPSQAPNPQLTTEDYAQVDITLIKLAAFPWYRFYTSYGDLAGILGFIVRKHGFSITDKGILLRYELLDDIKEARKHFHVSDKSGMLHLSDDPVKIMEFLGLGATRWEQGFRTQEELFSWVLKCRLLSRDVLENVRDVSRDRQKERKRDLFSTFLFDYCTKHLPEIESAPQDSSVRLACQRPYLQDQAIQFFGLQYDFINHFTAFHQAVVTQQAEHLLRQALTLHTGKSGKKLAEFIRAFRRWTRFDQYGNPHLSETQMMDEDSQLISFLRPDLEELDDRVVDFVKRNWDEVKTRERATSRADG